MSREQGPRSAASASPDARLLARVASGDAAALRTLYDAHAPWLSVRLNRRCNDPELSAEVLQDTFVALWRGAHRFRGDGDVAAWLWGIAIRRLISALRAGKHRHRDVDWEHVGSDGEVPVALQIPSAEDRVLVGVEYGDLGAALRKLSPEMRAVVQATVLDGLTTKEAARLLGLKENTVKTRLHRARAQLRLHLTEVTP